MPPLFCSTDIHLQLTSTLVNVTKSRHALKNCHTIASTAKSLAGADEVLAQAK